MEGAVHTHRLMQLNGRQCLLETLAWFSRWKELHDKRVKEKHTTEYIFFANETWFCIKSLVLGHIAAMHIYCVIKGESISLWTMNTDTLGMLDRWLAAAPTS